MKIAYDISYLGMGHYIPALRTGIFRVVENLAYGLRNSGEHDLTFCTSNSSFALFSTLDYLDTNPELSDVPLPHQNWQFKQKLFRSLYKLNHEVESASGFQQLALKTLRKAVYLADRCTEPFYEPIDYQNLAGFDIYHSPYHPIPQKIRESVRIKNFLTVHDLIPILYPQFFKVFNDNSLKRTIDDLDSESWILCVSQSTKNDLCNYSKAIDPSKVFVTHLAASDLFYPCSDFHKFVQVRNKYNIPDLPYFLSLSTLEPRKNIDHIIRCFIRLLQQEKIQDLCLVLVGAKGWDYNKILDEIPSDAYLKDRIIFTGYVADEDLAALYSGSIAFIYVSLYEGFGLPPLEAMQCGVPVITSDTSSLPEVVGDAGIMVPPKDANELCNNMLRLFEDCSLRQSMSHKSLQQSQKFSWRKFTEESVATYRAAVDS
jgi:glycosyltransferase involved in cell wall biosynthesis